MAEFTEITSQEQLDRVIGERLRRERETVEKRYADYDDLKNRNAEYAKQIESLTASLNDANEKVTAGNSEMDALNARIREYETASVKTRIANEAGIPLELADRLSGEDEDAIRADAQALAKFISRNSAPPLASLEQPVETDSKKAAIQKMVAGMNTN